MVDLRDRWGVSVRILDLDRRYAKQRYRVARGEDLALAPALLSGRGIRRRIAAAAVKQPVIVAGRAGVQLLVVDQQSSDAPKGKIAHDARPGGAATYDENIGL